jgi:nitrogen fixation protein NifQ
MAASESPGYAELIEAALDPGDAVTLALAGVIALAPQRRAPYNVGAAGLDAPALAALQQRFFGNLRWSLCAADNDSVAGRPVDEFDDLLALLLEYRTVPCEESRWLAHAVATASMGQNHLWQDLGLPSRRELSWLMRQHFRGLAERNSGDMRWKKFLYRELCQRAGIRLCKSPSCAECSDVMECFPDGCPQP